MLSFSLTCSLPSLAFHVCVVLKLAKIMLCFLKSTLSVRPFILFICSVYEYFVQSYSHHVDAVFFCKVSLLGFLVHSHFYWRLRSVEKIPIFFFFFFFRQNLMSKVKMTSMYLFTHVVLHTVLFAYLFMSHLCVHHVLFRLIIYWKWQWCQHLSGSLLNSIRHLIILHATGMLSARQLTNV